MDDDVHAPRAASPRSAAGSYHVESESRASVGAHAVRESECQCRIRDANEAAERTCGSSRAGVPMALRCECGDPACRARVTLMRSEYEAVRAYGSRFVVGINHENPESACVLCEYAEFAVIDVVAAGARYHVLARNPRHAWTGAGDRSTR